MPFNMLEQKLTRLVNHEIELSDRNTLQLKKSNEKKLKRHLVCKVTHKLPTVNGPQFCRITVFFIDKPFSKWQVVIYMQREAITLSFLVDLEELMHVNEAHKTLYQHNAK